MGSLNFKIIYRFLGLTAVLNGIFMFIAIPFSMYHKEEAQMGILNAGIITVFLGLLLYFFNKPTTTNIHKKEGYLIVTLGWLTLSFTGMLPYLFTGAIPNITDAFFETLSGYSTTGSSILTDIESMPKGILFWRSATHWIGGIPLLFFLFWELAVCSYLWQKLQDPQQISYIPELQTLQNVFG